MTTLKVETIFSGDRVVVTADWRGSDDLLNNQFDEWDQVSAVVGFYVDGEFDQSEHHTLPIQEINQALKAWNTWLMEHKYFKICCCPNQNDGFLRNRVKMFKKLGFKVEMWQGDGSASMVLDWETVFSNWKKES